jgi:hypothetical protein
MKYAKRLFALALPLALGVGLRSWNLLDQVLVGDERWDPAAALGLPFGKIVTGFVFENANYSAPESALYRLLFDAGFSLGELSLRIPALLCGVTAIVLIPRLSQRSLQRWSSSGETS